MKKAIILFLVLAVAGLAFVSCYDDVTFCYGCGSRNIKLLNSTTEDGKTYHLYKCGTCNRMMLVEEL